VKVFHDFQEYTKREGLYLTIGFFDGLHIGHTNLLKKLIEESRNTKNKSAVLTFIHHPLSVVAPHNTPELIITRDEKLKVLELLGVDYVFLITFEGDLADTTPKEFVEDIMVNRLGVKKIFVGRNFRFGRGRKGDIEFLERKGKDLGFEVEAVPLTKVDGEIVSSSRLRQLIKKGDLAKVKKFLRRNLSLRGEVVKGRGISRQIKYPTANIILEKRILPPEGVYAGWARVGEQLYPTAFDLRRDGQNVIEAHLISLEEDLYGKQVEIIFEKRIRGRLNFPSRQQAQKQIEKDVAMAKQILTDTK